MSNFKKPEVKEKRLKMFVYGPHGSRKTTSLLQFNRVALIDMEAGSEEYSALMNKNQSEVLHTVNADEVKNQVKWLLTEKHNYFTLGLDPITIYYQAVQDKWSRTFEKYAKTEKEVELQDFGMRYWGRVKSDYKSLLRMITQLDMNVIVTAHQKDVYGANMVKLGVGADSMKGDLYVFDYVFRLEVVNGKAIAFTEKQRSDPLMQPKFPSDFEWSYDNFCKFYGKNVLEKEVKPVKLASAEQVARIKELVEIVNVSDEEITKWYTKADVDSFSEMTEEQIVKCIKFLEAKLDGVTKKEKK